MTAPGSTEPPQAGPTPRDAGLRDGGLAVVLAGGRGARLLDLGEREARAALPLAGRRRVVDYALQEVARAGLGRVRALLQHQPATLRDHLPAAWGDRLALEVLDGAGRWGGPADALADALRDAEGEGPVTVVSGARAGAFDLPALLAAHRASGAGATLLAVPADGAEGLALALDGARVAALGADGGGWLDGGVLVLDPAWALRAWPRLAAPGWEDLLALALADGALAAHPQAGAVWRDPATPDAFRRAWLELAGPVPFPLPPERGAPDEPMGGPDLVMEAGGLTLSVPRFGARRGGRWTLLEDSVVMPGARVAPGARLTRTLVAPGAIVPAGLVVGEDPAEDARWFRVCPPSPARAEADPAPTVLVTAPLLARRAAERMRLRPGGALRPVPSSALTPTES